MMFKHDEFDIYRLQQICDTVNEIKKSRDKYEYTLLIKCFEAFERLRQYPQMTIDEVLHEEKPNNCVYLFDDARQKTPSDMEPENEIEIDLDDIDASIFSLTSERTAAADDYQVEDVMRRADTEINRMHENRNYTIEDSTIVEDINDSTSTIHVLDPMTASFYGDIPASKPVAFESASQTSNSMQKRPLSPPYDSAMMSSFYMSPAPPRLAPLVIPNTPDFDNNSTPMASPIPMARGYSNTDAVFKPVSVSSSSEDDDIGAKRAFRMQLSSI